MAQDTTPAIIVYQGDGSNSVFDIPFDKGYYGEIKVLFVRRGLADYTYNPNTFTVSGRLYAWQNGGAKIYTHTPNPAIGAPTYNSSDVEQAETVSAIAGQTITVDSLVCSRAVQHDISSNMKLTWTGDMLEIGDFICIVRNTERGQPYEMPNNQKHIERALDNIERQVQEVKDATDNALKIDPSHDIPDSHKMNPIDWLKSIIRCMDFSVRALRYANGWLDYSLDDPNIANADKTWTHLLNTDNIKGVRERKEIEDGEEHRWVEYLDQNGQWQLLVDSNWDARIEEIERIAGEAKQIADEAKDVADDAKEIAEGIDEKAQEALDTVTELEEKIIVKSDTIPNASADLVGSVYQYVGETSQTYEHGYIYECKAIPADALVFSPDTVSCSWTDLSSFLQAQTEDYNSVVAGTMTYVENAELWRLVFKDANGNTVLTYQQYTGDWERVGFTFNDIFHDGDVVSFVRYTDSTQIWERIDVQPNHNEDIAELYDEVANLKGLGRFLSVWNCATGLAETNPPESPYTYHTGDYFLVGTIGATNYRPDGATYITGVPSTTVETNEVKLNDVYIYDGANWKLQANSQREYTFSGIAGSPYDNTNLSNALNGLQGQITTNKDTMDSHIGNTNNPHSVTKAQVGLGNVDNTSDLNKPISTATQTALDGKQATISDLATIRSNAQAGKAASDTIATYGDIVTHDVAEFATAAQGAKADTALQGGDNVSELVNDAGYLVMDDLTNFVTKNTAQTISGLKTFTGDITLSGTTSIKNTTNGVSYTMLYRDASGIHVGTSTQALLLAGSNARPKFNNNDIAMLSDVPTAVSQLTNDSGFITNAVNDLQNYTLTSNLATVATSGSYNDLSNKPTIPTVNNPTITITQGGVTKGSFTLNQASGDTIELDAGGGGGGAVDSVNGKTGVVVLTATDVGALPDSTVIPDAQIQSDWNQADNTKVDYIKNKPTIPTVGNGTITITQGGTTKGSFTTNQSGNTTIALDAGGGGGADTDLSNLTATGKANISSQGTYNSSATYSSGTVGAAISGKADTNLNNVSAGIDFVVESQLPTAQNNYTWYRKYKSGWVEQGGCQSASNTAINLPIAMADYTATITANVAAGISQNMAIQIAEKTATTLKAVSFQAGGYTVNWQVVGKAL